MNPVQGERRVFDLIIATVFVMLMVAIVVFMGVMWATGDRSFVFAVAFWLVCILGALVCALMGVRSPSVLLALATGLSAIVLRRQGIGMDLESAADIVTRFADGIDDAGVSMEAPSVEPPAKRPFWQLGRPMTVKRLPATRSH